MVLLDATAGNRMMWRNKKPPLTVFIDREMNLFRPPDIFADNRYCPFRADVFDCVVYDPPYYVRSQKASITSPWMFYNPDLKKRPKSGGNPFSHFGFYHTKRELFINLYQASQEFYRISRRLCFKWGDGDFGLWRILVFFRPWVEIFRRGFKSRGYKKRDRGSWVTFIREH